MYRLIAAFITCLCVFIFTGCSMKNESSLPEVSDVTATQGVSEYIPYSNIQLNYRISVPSNWIQTLNNGEFTLTDQKSGAYISVWREDYFPGINSFTEKYLADYYARDGASLQSYVKESGNEIKVIASSTKNNVPVTEYKYVYWTYSSVYYISYVAETSKEEVLYPIFEMVYSSFELINQEPTIKEGYSCIYNRNIGLSIEYPLNWEYKSSADGFNITNNASGSSITLSVIDPIEQFKELTEIEYSKMIQNIVSGASLTSFSNTGAEIYGNAFYADKTGKYMIENVLVDNKTYTLALTFVSLSDYTSIDEPVFHAMLDSIRYYGVG